jgi:predicted PurR-regulated permease PerM
MLKLPISRLSSGAADPVRVMLLAFGTITILYFGRDVLQPLALAILLALVLSPPAKLLERYGLPRAAACVLTVGAAVAVIATAMAVVVGQVSRFTAEFDAYKLVLQQKLGGSTASGGVFAGIAYLVNQSVDAVGTLMSAPKSQIDVRIVTDPLTQLFATLAPILSIAGIAVMVVILTTFLMIRRDDMSDRIVSLFGNARIGVTTRALDEAGGRISSYLSAFSAVNAMYGLIIGLGLWTIGVPLAVLWGALAGVLRFIPYVGAAAGVIGPLLLSAVFASGWLEPIQVLVLFGVVEALLVTSLEPIIYGKSTGVSPIGLLVAATFWTWLWGPVGLLLSTPLTVSLAVAGKYVPGLGGIAILLSQHSGMPAYLSLYHRLLAADATEASQLIGKAIEKDSLATALDTLIVPVLIKCRDDLRTHAISAAECGTVWRNLDDIIDDLEWKSGVTLRQYVPGRASTTGAQSILGVAWHDSGDLMMLRMLNLLLAPWDRSLMAIGPGAEPAMLYEVIAASAPEVMLVGYFPGDEAPALGKFLTALASGPGAQAVVEGAWGGHLIRPVHAGRTRVTVESLAQARDVLLSRLQSASEVGQHLLDALRSDSDQPADELYERVRATLPLDRLCFEVLDPLYAALPRLRAEEPDAAERVLQFLRSKLRPHATAVRSFSAEAPLAVLANPGMADDEPWLMMLATSLRARGWDVLYLGVTVAGADLVEVVGATRPDIMVVGGRDDKPDPYGFLLHFDQAHFMPTLFFAPDAHSAADLPPGTVLPGDLGLAVIQLEERVTKLKPADAPMGRAA